MSSSRTYCGIVAKICAMKSKLLTQRDFESIAEMKSVPDVIEFLKNKPAYSELLTQMDESLYHRGNIEKLLYQSLYDDYTRLFHFSSIEQKRFLKLYLKRYEVDLINYCLRIVFNNYDRPFDLNYKKEFFDRYSDLSIDRLITSKNIDDLIENLKETEYYEPLKKIKDSGAASLFDYDLALDLYYFTKMWKVKGRILKKKDLAIFTRDCGSKIDLLNLQWIYRAKKYYQMSAPDIYNLIIPIQYRISKDAFKDMIEAPSVNEFSLLAEKTVYAKKYNFEQQKSIELMYKECLHSLYIADSRKSPYSIASITTYLFLKEEEIYKLTTALECVRYGLSSRETLGYLGGTNQ